MWLRSDKRELRNKNNNQQPKKLLKSLRKKRKRPKNQYSRTIKLMKTEKSASVLSTTQYPEDELTLYNDKAIKRVTKHKSKTTESNFNSINNEYNTFSTSEPISYDLNTLDIESPANALDYHHGSTSERFQTLDTQYEFDCNYAKASTEIHDLLLKRKFKQFHLTFYNSKHFFPRLKISFFSSIEFFFLKII
jgi:hypothetical protein